VLRWLAIAFPSLLLNYFGQGAYAIAHPLDPTNLFFALTPGGFVRLPLILLSVLATIVASQALISGTFR
jgi:KUP system potassium uptake protein